MIKKFKIWMPARTVTVIKPLDVIDIEVAEHEDTCKWVYREGLIYTIYDKTVMRGGGTSADSCKNCMETQERSLANGK